MRRCESTCFACTTFGLPCMTGCPNKKYVRLYCDRCKKETQELYRLGEQEVCEDCLLLYADEKKCDRCGKAPYTTLYLHDNECLCEDCLAKATRIDITEE